MHTHHRQDQFLLTRHTPACGWHAPGLISYIADDTRTIGVAHT